MTEKNVQEYLEKGMYGTPELKQAERKKYLGTFRERVIFTMDFTEVAKKQQQRNCQQEFDRYPKQHLLINGELPVDLQMVYLKLAQTNDCSFTITSKDTTGYSSDLAIVYTSQDAINIETVAISAKYPCNNERTTPNQAQPDTQTKTNKSSGFFRHLFH